MRTPTAPLRFTQTLQASFIGHLAADILREHQDATVIGTTSRGIFLLTQRQRMIFLSYENFRGPLTVNLEIQPDQPLPVFNGQAAALLPDEIALPDLGVHILLDQAQNWLPPSPPATILVLHQIDAVLRQIARIVIETKRGVGFVPLLAFIFDLPARPTVPISLQPTIVNVVLLKQLLLQPPLSASLPQIKDLMGLGRGLTPSGDDFINGLLLTFNRIPQRVQYQAQLDELNREVVEMAFSKTTALSANLILAAAHGSADERLLRALDGLITGALSPDQIIQILDTYGSSSGIDALAGISLLFQALIQK
jgi:hypothetical protein